MLLFLASLAGIALLAGLAWLLGFRTRPRLADAAAAERLADCALNGFRAVETVLDADRGAALLHGGDGRVVLVRPMGDRWTVRVLAHAQVEIDGAKLRLRAREPGFPTTTLDLGDEASRWAALLA